MQANPATADGTAVLPFVTTAAMVPSTATAAEQTPARAIIKSVSHEFT